MGNYPSHHPKTASRRIGDEVVILDLEANVLMTLNDSAGRIWELADGETEVREIANLLGDEYDTDPSTMEDHILGFVRELADGGWILLQESARHTFLDHRISQIRSQLSAAQSASESAELNAEDLLKQRCLDQCILYGATLELTFGCNERCRHCYIPAPDNELSRDEWTGLMDDLADLGCLRLVLTGGEVLLHPHFLDLLRYARRKRFAVDIFTNGLLLDDRILEDIAECYPRTIQFSLYGVSEALHDHITRVPGSHRRTMDAILRTLDKNIPIAIKMPIMNVNFHEYEKVKRFCEEIGAAYQFNIAISPRNNGETEPLRLRVEDEKQLEYFVADRDIASFSPADELVGEQRESRGQLIPCGAGFSAISCSPCGEIYGCNQLLYSLGNIREFSLREIWEDSPRTKYLRSIRVDDLKPCSTCSIFEHCNRCPGLALSECGDMLGRSSYDCLVAEARSRVRGAQGTQADPS